METLKETKRLRISSALQQVWLLSAVLLLSGCRICADCEDQAYPAYGGAWQRTIRDTGRVGSVFEPAGAKAFDFAARDQPEDAVEQERQRYKERGSDVNDPGESEEDESAGGDDGEGKLEDRKNELRERDLDDIDNPKERELRERKLDEIDVKVIQGSPTPPVL